MNTIFTSLYIEKIFIKTGYIPHRDEEQAKY